MASEQESELVSKSERKRQARAVLDLARQLVELKDGQLAAVELPDDVREAVHDTRAIRSHVARKRQLHYLGKVLRQYEVAPIARDVERVQAPGQEETAQLHLLERWRAQLIEHGDAALSELYEACPKADRQALRTLVRQARAETDKPGPPAAARRLFQALRSLSQHCTLPEPSRLGSPDSE